MILDPNTAPWKTMNANTTKPKADVLKAECIRRWRAFIQEEDPAVSKECGAKEPSNKYWSKEKVMQYLCDHPISAARDISFLRAEILKRKDAAKDAEKEAATEKRLLAEAGDKGAKKYKSWTGKYPYLRLIHAIVDNDDIKRAFIHHNDVPSGRMAVENRNTKEAKAANVWQRVADKWNDVGFAPATESLPDLFRDTFAVSETIPHDMVVSFLPPNADKAKERFESMIRVLKLIIPKWEKSGQGDGGGHRQDDDDNPFVDNDDVVDDDNDDDDDDDDDDDAGEGGVAKEKHKWGETKGRGRYSLSKRQDFFQNTNSYVLYMWHIIDKHDLIGTSMSMLSDAVGSLDGARGIPSAIRKSNNNDDNDENNEDELGSIGSKSQSSKSLMSTNDAEEDGLAKSIRSHGEHVLQLAKIKAEEMKKNRALAEAKEKRKRSDAVDQQLLSLRAEKRQLVIRLSLIQPGTDAGLERAISSSIDEVQDDIRKKEMQLDEFNIPTPIKNNRTPEEK
jgi:hypothetical protein